MKLPNNQNFLKEREMFLEKINQLPTDKDKKEASDLLNKLTDRVLQIENLHEQVLLNKQVPSDVQDIRSSITSLRKSIYNKLGI